MRSHPHRKLLQGPSQHSTSSSEMHQSQSPTSPSQITSHESGGTDQRALHDRASASPPFQVDRETSTTHEHNNLDDGSTLTRGAGKKPASGYHEKPALDKTIGTRLLAPKYKNAQMSSTFANPTFRPMEIPHMWEGHTPLEPIREEVDAMHQSILPGKPLKPSKKRKKLFKPTQSSSGRTSDDTTSPSDVGLSQPVLQSSVSAGNSTDVTHEVPPANATIPNGTRESTAPNADGGRPDKSQRSTESAMAQTPEAPLEGSDVGLTGGRATALPSLTQNLSGSAEESACDGTNRQGLPSGVSTHDVHPPVRPSGQAQHKKPTKRSTHPEHLAGEQVRSSNPKPRPIAAEASKTIDDALLHGISSRVGPSKVSKPKTTKPSKVGPTVDRDQRWIAANATQDEQPPRKASVEMFMLLAKIMQDEQEEAARIEARREDARNRDMERLRAQLEQVASQKEGLAAKVKQHESTIQESLSKHEDLKSSKKELECNFNGLQKKHKDLECAHSKIIEDYKHEKELKSKAEERVEDRARNENLLTQQLNTALEKYDSINTTLKAQAESSKKLSESYDSLLVPLNELRNDESLRNHLKECLDLMRSLHSSNSALPDSIERLKEMTKLLEENIESGFSDARESTAGFQKAASTTEERFTSHLQTLKQELSSWKAMQNQVTELRENNAIIEERSTGLQDTITTLNAQFNESKARETGLQNSVASLLEELASAKAAVIPIDESKIRDLEAKNQDLMMQLETARSDVSENTGKLQALSESEERLRTERVELQEKLRLSEEECIQLRTQCDQATENVVIFLACIIFFR
ncbi:uncharacterized protein K452DRAFT_77419 [Aplosporella prunicola CBS 121167]|uniref:Uncharacterized protein n=1 Tax=Aplosporella prunicola CBS 121167 TaxID=1176127 RepID=A0A6A6B8A5_9PEZI|nr:uncharacterized protein K452DRAFT_77419 [Aplosporella prunicola CBS 121167]KAF2139434.1 hypothetical protein K452DRAFT_77419 [Aplosporella prunicola CBS 121167]